MQNIIMKQLCPLPSFTAALAAAVMLLAGLAGMGSAHAQSQAAETQARMMELEEQVRMLTGRVDELEFRLRETQRNFDNYRGDAEMRFQEMGGAPAAPGAAAPLSPDGGPASIMPAPASGTLPNPPPPGSSSSLAPAAAAAAVVLPEGDAQLQYDYGIERLKMGEFDQAREAFQLFLKANPKHQLAGNAQYWLGETYYVQGKYKDAADSFLKGYTTYSKSPKAPDSLLKLGMTLSALKQKDAACATFGELNRRFPKAGEAVVARAQRERKKAGC